MLSGIVEDVRAKLHENLTAIRARLPLVKLGATEAAKFKTPPSVVFVPVREQITPPQKRGASPGALWDRKVFCALRIYDDGIDACEELTGHVLAAMHGALTAGSYGVVGAEWDTSGQVSAGQVVVLEVFFSAQFVQEQTTEQVVEEIPQTGTIEDIPIGA